MPSFGSRAIAPIALTPNSDVRRPVCVTSPRRTAACAPARVETGGTAGGELSRQRGIASPTKVLVLAVAFALVAAVAVRPDGHTAVEPRHPALRQSVSMPAVEHPAPRTRRRPGRRD